MIYVSIIDDDKEFRDKLALLIEGTKEFSCVGVYGDCETALKNIENDPPNVILMDIEIPGKMSGIQCVRTVKALIDDVDVIMLTVHDEPELIFESLKAGACGYLVKISS